MTRSVRDFSSIYGTEQVTLSFDFSPEPPGSKGSPLAVGETLVSNPGVSPIVSITLVAGIDPTPGSRLIGAPSIDGVFVRQSVGAGQPSGVYNLIATVDTSAGQRLELSAHLPIAEIE